MLERKGISYYQASTSVRKNRRGCKARKRYISADDFTYIVTAQYFGANDAKEVFWKSKTIAYQQLKTLATKKTWMSREHQLQNKETITRTENIFSV